MGEGKKGEELLPCTVDDDCFHAVLKIPLKRE